MMSEYSKVRVRCEVCKRWLGEREVEEIQGEYLELPCRRCFHKQMENGKPPDALEAEWIILEQSMTDRSFFFHPKATGLIDVNMEYNGAEDAWVFRTPRKLTPQAFGRSKAHIYEYYQGIIRDMKAVGIDEQNGRVIEEIERALLALQANRIRNVVDPPMLTNPLSY